MLWEFMSKIKGKLFVFRFFEILCKQPYTCFIFAKFFYLMLRELLPKMKCTCKNKQQTHRLRMCLAVLCRCWWSTICAWHKTPTFFHFLTLAPSILHSVCVCICIFNGISCFQEIPFNFSTQITHEMVCKHNLVQN